MKIIITPTGKAELKEIELKFQKLKRAKSTNSIMNLKGQSKILLKNNYNNNQLDNNMTMTKNTIYNQIKVENKINIKKISLSKPKINLTREMHLKYGSQYETSLNDEFVINPFSPPISPRNIEKEPKQKIELRNIFTPKAIKAMKKDFIEKKIIKDLEMYQTAHSFRSLFKPKTSEIQILNEMLLKEINPDKNNLIEYFSQKEYISPLSIKVLSLYDNDRMSKLNKVCQILFKNEDERMKLSQSINYKLNAKERSMKNIFTQSMTHLSKNFNKTKGIFGKYLKKANHISLLNELVNDMKTNYWEKFKVDKQMKLLRKNKDDQLENNNDEYILMKKYIMEDFDE